jgi:TP901 family phage tail tape measure protein
MSDRDLKIRLIFEGQDRLSKKIGNLFDASKRLKGQMRETRDIQRGLEGALARSEAFEKQSAAVAEYSSKLAAANEKLAQRKAALAAVDKPNQQMVQGLLAAERMAKQAADSLKREESALEQVTGEMTRAGMATDNLAKQQADLKARIDSTKASLETLTASQKRFGKLQSREIAARERGRENVMGGGMQLAATAAAAMPMLRMARSAGNFQSGMVDIQQNANLSNRETAALAANIRQAAADTVQPISNMQAALQSLVAMGMDPRIATGLLRPIGTMATTYKLEALDAANASFAAYSNLKVPISQAGKAMEAMVFAAKAGKVEVADMARVFPQLTGSAQVLGMSGVTAVAQLGAALEIAGKSASGPDEAATNVNNLLNKLADNETLKKFSGFGINAKAAYAAGDAVGATKLETLLVLLEKVRAKGGTVNDVFGDMQARSAAAALLANKAEFANVAKGAAGSKGVIGQDLKTRLENDPLAKQAQLMSRLGDAGITLGTHLLPPLTALAEVTADLVSRFAAFAENNPRLAAGLATLAVSAVTLSGGIAALRIGFGLANYTWMGALSIYTKTLSAFSYAAPVFTRIGAGLAMMRGWLVRVTAQLLFAAPAAWAAMAPFLPWIAAVAGLTAAGIALYNHWGKISAFLANLGSTLWNAAGNIGSRMWDGLIGGITGGLAKVKATIEGAGDKIANWFKAKLGIRSPSRLFAEYGGHLMQGLSDGIDGRATSPLDSITRLSRQLTAALAIGAAAASPAAAGAIPATGSAGGSTAMMNVTINIQQQPGQSAQDLAKQVADELDRRQREAAAARRSAFRDYGE